MLHFYFWEFYMNTVFTLILLSPYSFQILLDIPTHSFIHDFLFYNNIVTHTQSYIYTCTNTTLLSLFSCLHAHVLKDENLGLESLSGTHLRRTWFSLSQNLLIACDSLYRDRAMWDPPHHTLYAGMSTVNFQFLFRQLYCWDLLSLTSLSFKVYRTLQLMIPWSSDSNKLFTLSL